MTRFGFVAAGLLWAGCTAPSGHVPAAEGWEVAKVVDFRPGEGKNLVVLAERQPDVSVLVQEVPKSPGHEFRPFLVVDGNRIELEERGSLQFMEAGLSVYVVDGSAVGAAGRWQLAVEQLGPEGRRRVSLAAFREAARLGFPTLPYPEPGKPYSFTLKLADGTLVQSSEFAGRVILIDCWATWCGPCMALMPTLVELSKVHGERLAIISVNLDDEPEEALATLRTRFGPQTNQWHHVAVPKDIQPLWYRSLGRSEIPRLLLIDGKGVLREEPPNADFEGLRKHVETAVRDSTG